MWATVIVITLIKAALNLKKKKKKDFSGHTYIILGQIQQYREDVLITH